MLFKGTLQIKKTLLYWVIFFKSSENPLNLTADYKIIVDAKQDPIVLISSIVEAQKNLTLNATEGLNKIVLNPNVEVNLVTTTTTVSSTTTTSTISTSTTNSNIGTTTPATITTTTTTISQNTNTTQAPTANYTPLIITLSVLGGIAAVFVALILCLL